MYNANLLPDIFFYWEQNTLVRQQHKDEDKWHFNTIHEWATRVLY